MGTKPPPCHIVQIGSDESAFLYGPGVEYVQRQVAYGILLDQLRPNSTMTLVILTREQSARPFRVGNVLFSPLIVNLRGRSKFQAWRDLYLTLDAIHREHPIDVLTTQTVHDEAWIALLFAKQRRCAIVGQIHYDIFNPHAKATLSRAFMGGIRYFATLRGMKYFTALRVVGEGISSQILERQLHARVHVLPVTMPMLDGVLNGSMQRENKVIFVGRLVEQKNLTAWLHVAELVLQVVPAAKFEIVGDGVLKEELELLADQKGLTDQVRFTGFVNYEHLALKYQSASVFLITSLYEGFGRVVAEALANRVPVVTPKITGIEDIVVHGQSGFLHSPNDMVGMATSVTTLLHDPDLVEKMGKWGEEDVKRRFNSQTLMRNWMQLLVDCAT